jgi:threonine dehydrogenase-like Zn-dependent dehydrogenase
MARAQGAEVVNFEKEDPTQVIIEMTGGIGVDRVIDAVGVDAQHAHHGPAAKKAKKESKEFEQEVKKVAPEQNPDEITGVPATHLRRRCAGASRCWPRREREPSSGSIHRPRQAIPSATRWATISR